MRACACTCTHAHIWTCTHMRRAHTDMNAWTRICTTQAELFTASGIITQNDDGNLAPNFLTVCAIGGFNFYVRFQSSFPGGRLSTPQSASRLLRPSSKSAGTHHVSFCFPVSSSPGISSIRNEDEKQMSLPPRPHPLLSIAYMHVLS